MKKIGIVLSVILFLFSFGWVDAADSATGSAQLPEVVTLGTGQTVNGNYFAAGQTAIISGTVRGDAYVAGGQVIVDGTVEGDLLAAGGTIVVNGKVGQDIRVVGGNLTINGEVGRNITAFGGNVDLATTAKIAGSVVAGGGNLNIAAPLTGEVTLMGGNVILANTTGNVKAWVGQLTLSPKAKVNGNLTYTSEQEAVLSPGATVSGTLNRQEPVLPKQIEREDFGRAASARLQQAAQRLTSALFILSFLNSLVVGFLLVNFFPNVSYQAILSIEERPWRTLGIGLLGVFVFPLLIILALVLVVGLSFGVVMAAFLGVVLYLAKIIFAYWLGARIIQGLQRMAGPGVTLFVGLAIYYLLSVITYLGPIVSLVALLFGAGAMLRTLRENYLAGRTAKLY